MNVPMVCFAPFKLHTNLIQGRLVQWVSWLARKNRAIFPPWPDPNSCTEAFMSVIFVIYLGIGSHGGMSSEMACWSVFNPNVPPDLYSIHSDIWPLYWHWGAWPSTQNSPSTSWSTFSSHLLQAPHPARSCKFPTGSYTTSGPARCAVQMGQAFAGTHPWCQR